jgi:hypothetical protein
MVCRPWQAGRARRLCLGPISKLQTGIDPLYMADDSINIADGRPGRDPDSDTTGAWSSPVISYGCAMAHAVGRLSKLQNAALTLFKPGAVTQLCVEC